MLALLIVVMQIANDRFLSPINVGNLLGQMTVMLIVAAGMTIIMISGEFDVAVGSVVGLSAAVAGWLHGALDAGRDRRRPGGLGHPGRTARAASGRAAHRRVRRHRGDQGAGSRPSS